jgi:hypothetical protein
MARELAAKREAQRQQFGSDIETLERQLASSVLKRRSCTESLKKVKEERVQCQVELARPCACWASG